MDSQMTLISDISMGAIAQVTHGLPSGFLKGQRDNRRVTPRIRSAPSSVSRSSRSFAQCGI